MIKLYKSNLYDIIIKIIRSTTLQNYLIEKDSGIGEISKSVPDLAISDKRLLPTYRNGSE